MAHLKHNQRDFLARLHKLTEIILLKLKAANPLMNKKTMELSVTVYRSANYYFPVQ